MEQPPVITPVTPANPTTHAAPPVKKGLPPIAWVGIGCGGLLLLGIIVAICLGVYGMNKAKELGVDFQKDPERAGAEMVVSMSQDLEKVSTDEEAGTITFRNKAGKEMTMTYKEISEGKFAMPDAGAIPEVAPMEDAPAEE